MSEQTLLQGKLEMSSSPWAAEDVGVLWGELLSNQLLCASAALLFLLMIRDIFRLTPPLLYALSHLHGTSSLEYNISNARIRNWASLASLLPFALISDRFGLYRPEYWSNIPAEWSSVASIGICLAFYLVRRSLHLAIKPRRMYSEDMATLRHSFYNFFLIMCPVMLLSAGLLLSFDVSEDIIRAVLLCEIALIYLHSLVRSGQILASRCGGLATILYLCALEILPLAILVISAVVF